MLYFSPLNSMLTWPAVGPWLLHTHFLFAGCVFAYVIAGPDPAPAWWPCAVVYLGCAIALHAEISQLMYGGLWIEIQAPIAQVQGGAEIMYYGGGIAELLLAAVSSPLGAPSAAHVPEMVRRGLATNPVVSPAARLGPRAPPRPARRAS